MQPKAVFGSLNSVKTGGTWMETFYRDEKSLVLGLINNEAKAYEILVDKYGTKLLQTCYLILKDYSLAEDVLQDTFLQVYKSINKFKGDSTLYTWIYRIGVNKCRDVMKLNKVLYPDYGLSEFSLIPDSNIEDTIIDDLALKSIKTIVFSLPPVYREGIILYYFEDLSIKDISAITGEKENTIKSRLMRGRSLLKKLMLKEGIVDETE